MSLAIDVRGLNKSFGDKHVVQDVSIQVEEGRICGFLGPNGSGKTTTLRMLCGLLTPDCGEGEVLGLDFRTATPRQIKRADRLHDPEVLALRGPDHRREPGLHRPRLRHGPTGASGSTRRWSGWA